VVRTVGVAVVVKVDRSGVGPGVGGVEVAHAFLSCDDLTVCDP
jgi:hypothetical protein